MLRCAITDRRQALSSPDGNAQQALALLLSRCATLVPAGLDLLIVREKNLPAAALLPFVSSVVHLFRTAPTRILVAQRADIALAAGAHGVHLSAAPGELTPAQVRRVFPAAFVSQSCHTHAEVEGARANAVSAILFGPVFGKSVAGSIVSPALGVDTLAQACALAGDTPVLALGGITQANTPECLAAGAAGIASIRLFFGYGI